jgi:hypothetical protein
VGWASVLTPEQWLPAGPRPKPGVYSPVWVQIDVNYPRLRPTSLLLAVVHVIASFAGFALLPALLSVLPPALPVRTSQPFVVLALLIPALTYLLLSWVWLIARILHDIGGNPRGGTRPPPSPRRSISTRSALTQSRRPCPLGQRARTASGP